MENDLIRSKVIEEGYKKIIELQFSDNVMIRRASTECLSNLIQELKLFETYCCNENNLKIMIALMDDEDFATRRAASGAIAMLTSFDKNLEIIMKNPRVFEILHELLEDESDEIVHRAMVICKNCCMARNEKKLEFLPIVLKLNEHGNGSISFLAKTTLDAIMKE
jgi:HEAT repeat protein